MLLTIDIGNTNLTIGLYEGETLKSHWRLATDHKRMPDEYGLQLLGVLQQAGCDKDCLTGICLASVVPNLTRHVEQACAQYLNLKPLIVEVGIKTGVRILYEDPSAVGADRVADAVAVHKLYGGPACVIDFGTATTFNAVNAKGEYLGGAITAGINLAAGALFEHAAKLPPVDLARPPSVIGKNTTHAMQSGLLFGYVSMVEGMVSRFRTELGEEMKVIATGGLAESIAHETETIDIIAPWLTLDGLRIIWEMNSALTLTLSLREHPSDMLRERDFPHFIMKLSFLAIWIFFLVLVFLIACTPQPTPAPTATATPLPPTETSTPSLTPTITKTATPPSTPTPAWVRRGPGIVRCTILLYHHVAISPIKSQYYIHPENFALQMQALSDWGFTPIPLSLLVKAITEGAELPPKPVIISFDDGRLDIYENAFPIMQKYNFPGVFYVLSGGLNDESLVGIVELKEMAAAGWEIGSHSHSHADLSKLDADTSYREVVSSRYTLERALGFPITSFAYPFGITTDTAGTQIHIAGYQSAVGLGHTNQQGPGNLFYLQRRPISWDYDLKRFAIVLGWEGSLSVGETPAP